MQHAGGRGVYPLSAEHGVEPDLIVGTSIGATNGALFAASPNAHGVSMLEGAWRDLEFRDLFPGSLWNRARAAVQQRTHLHANDHLRSWLMDRLVQAAADVPWLPSDLKEVVQVAFGCPP